jgi:RNA polymerase sigma factor (sigma-70 family)
MVLTECSRDYQLLYMYNTDSKNKEKYAISMINHYKFFLHKRAKYVFTLLSQSYELDDIKQELTINMLEAIQDFQLCKIPEEFKKSFNLYYWFNIYTGKFITRAIYHSKRESKVEKAYINEFNVKSTSFQMYNHEIIYNTILASVKQKFSLRAQEILTMYYDNKMPQKEIAEVLKITPVAVGKHLNSIKNAMKQEILKGDFVY